LEDLPALDEFKKDVCDNPVTLDEILCSLKGMENGKSPGSDGLTKEFYFKFIDTCVYLVPCCYNHMIIFLMKIVYQNHRK
jgi:hypothetical protein